MIDQLEKNKRNGQAFYDLMFNQCKPAEAVERSSETPIRSTILRLGMASRRSLTISSEWRVIIFATFQD
jgi:hypothetical protein